nr:MAG: polyprotein [Coypu aphthovirus]
MDLDAMNSTDNAMGGANDSSTTSSQREPSNPLNAALGNALNTAVSAAAIAALADQDTEETTQMSDRLHDAVRGNTSINTQSYVGSVVAYAGKMNHSNPTSTADKSNRTGPAFSRAYTFSLNQWSQDNDYYSYLYYSLPHCFSVDRWGMFGRMIQQHSFNKVSFRVQVQCNLSVFHGGSLLVAAVPEFYVGQTSFEPPKTWQTNLATHYNPNMMLVYPHQILNARTNTSVDLQLPYVNVTPTSYGQIHCPWTIVLMVLSPLQVPPGTSTSVEITMSVTPVCTVFNGLRAETQGGVPVEVGPAAYQFLTTDPNRSVPAYGRGINPVTSYMIGQITNAVAVARLDTLCTFPGPFVTATATGQGQRLFASPVSFNHSIFQNSAVEVFSRFFSQFRGSLNLTVMYTGAAVHKGKFLVVYTPPGVPEPTGIDDAMLGTYALWDLGLNSSLNFTVPYIAPSDFRMALLGENTTINYGGIVSMFQLTTLTMPANTATTGNIIVMVSAGSDFCYRNLTDPYTLQGETENQETGASVPIDATKGMEGQRMLDYTGHSDVGFILDRHAFYKIVGAYPATGKLSFRGSSTLHEILPSQAASDNMWTVIDLNPFTSFQNTSHTMFLQLFTYYHSDLSVRITPLQAQPRNSTNVADAQYPGDWLHQRYGTVNNTFTTGTTFVRWVPAGTDITPKTWLNNSINTFRPSNIPTQTVPVSLEFGRSFTPMVTQTNVLPSGIEIEVPYTSPLSVLPVRFCGYGNLNKSEFGVAPGATYGAFSVQTWCDPESLYMAFIRMRNPRVFCPRAGGFTRVTNTFFTADTINAVSYRMTGWIKDLTQDGDVESNPGPYTPDDMKIVSLIQTLLQMARKLTSGTWWKKFVKSMISLLKGVRLAYKGDYGGFLLEMTTLMMDFDDVEKFTASICEVFEIPDFSLPKPLKGLFQPTRLTGEEGYDEFGTRAELQGFSVNSANALFNLCKNASWGYDLILAIVNKVKETHFDGPTKKQELLEKFKQIPNCEDQRKFVEQLEKECQEIAWKEGLQYLKLLTLRTKDEPRPEPVVILLHGQPGQGKSVSASIMAQVIAREICGDPTSVWTMPPASEYFDGYHGQAVVIMDDLGQNPDGADYTTFCQMVSTTAFRVNMANLEDKGRLFTSKVIIATTNMPPNHCPVTISAPSALRRRYTFCCEVVAQQKIGTVLNISKALQYNNNPFFGTEGRALYDGAVLYYAETGLGLVPSKNIMTMRTLITSALSAVEDRANVARSFTLYRPDLPVVPYTPVEPKEFKTFHTLLKLALAGTTAAGVAYSAYKFFTKETKHEEGAYTANGPLKRANRQKKLQVRTEGMVVTEQAKFFKSVRPVVFYKNGNKIASACVLGLKQHKVVISSHLWNLDWDSFQVGIHTYTHDKVTDVELVNGDISLDVVIVDLRKGSQFPNITKHFDDEIAAGEAFGVVHNDTFGKVVFTATVHSTKLVDIQASDVILPKVLSYSARTERGYCGAPIIERHGSNWIILGVHSAGTGSTGFCTRLTAKSINSALDALESPELQGITMLPEGPVISMCPRTKLRKSLAWYPEVPKAPAVMSNDDYRCKGDLDRNVLQKFNRDYASIPYNYYLKRSAIDYAKTAGSLIGFSHPPLSVEDAIAGVENFDSVDDSKSPGLPFTLQHVRRPALMNANQTRLTGKARKMMRRFWNGNYKEHMFQSFLKDELRKLDKIESGDTRVVEVASFPHMVVGRRLLGRLSSSFHSNPGFKLGSAVGCNPDTDWTKFGHELEKYKYHYDVDFKAFDASHSAGVIEAVADAMCMLGVHPRVRSYLGSLVNSKHAYKQYRFKKDGGLPSGCSATSIINSIANNIILRTVLYMTYDNYEEGDVVCLTYGDDLVVASNHDLDWVKLRENYAKMGYTITAADKSPVVKDTGIHNLQFLKRKFHRDGVLYRPYFPYNELRTSLAWEKPGTTQEKLFSMCCLAAHLPKEQYVQLFEPFEPVYKILPWELVNATWKQQMGVWTNPICTCAVGKTPPQKQQ